MLGGFASAAPGLAQDTRVPPSQSAGAAGPVEGAPAASDATADNASQSEIIVTGSRIVRADLAASSPVTVLTGADLKLTNSVTTESLLSQNPQFVPATTNTTNNGNVGVATVDLRGLQPKRTLVLVDGRRQVAYDSNGVVDLNTIPPALIKRVDVLTGGASTVYGSDAVAGVVNFILDDEFKGLRFDGSTSITGRGDGPEYNASVTGGIKLGDRGNFVASAGYTRRFGIFQDARGYSAQNLDSGDSATPPFASGSSNTTPTAFDTAGGRTQIGPNGTLVPFYAPYNFNPANYLQVPLERYNVTALVKYRLTDNIEFFGRGTYIKSRVQAIEAPTATAGFAFTVSQDNPFLTPAERATFFNADNDPTGANSIQLGIRRRVIEAGGRVEDYDNDAYQFIGGFRGDIGETGLRYEVFGQYADTTRHNLHANDLSYNRTFQAVDAIAGPNGTVVCRDPSNGCVPINLFGINTITPAALAFVKANGTERDRSNELVTGGDISGDLKFLQSPLADRPAAFTVGVEYRREFARTDVDAAYGSGDLIYYGQGQSVQPFAYDVKEVYTEFKMPLIADRPFFHALNVEGGYRYSDYSTVGGVHTFKGGGDYSPVDGIRFRGEFNRAVRAPNINELVSPLVSATDNLNFDPCAGTNPVGNAQLSALCIATGVPSARLGTVNGPIAGQVNVFQGGNRNLKAEKSNTYTVGVVLSPPQLRNLSVTVDYFNINIANAIGTFGGSPQNIVNGCYVVAQSAASPFCQALVRNPLSGEFSGGVQYGVVEANANNTALKTSGIDVGVSYRTDVFTSFKVSLAFNGTFTNKYTRQSDTDTSAAECAGKFGLLCNLNPIPKWKHIAGLTIGYDEFSLLTRWRYIGAISGDAGTDIFVQRISPQNYFDMTASVAINQRFDFNLGVQNLTDRDPPIFGGTAGGTAYNSGNTYPNIYDSLGRTFFAGVSAKF